MDEGALPRERILWVLESCGVKVERSESDNPSRPRIVLSKDETVEVQVLPQMVPRRMIMRFAYKFDIHPHYFWHPERVPQDRESAN